MNSCQAFRHPEAKMMCYAAMNGQLGDQSTVADLQATEQGAPVANPSDTVETVLVHPEAEQYHAASEQLLSMARNSGKV